ncbi:hypothetical protein [Clostridium sp. UBA3061]|uniref:hypothetical protein n=1 Tax=Clostridium sp. UBA3061 TaxID=1946353 RepID=UPI003216ACDB
MNKICDEVKEGMNKVTSEVKDMYTEVKIQYGEKKEDIKEFISNKKFVHDLKNQMKDEVREEGQLAKNLYNKAMVGGKTIAKELKNDVKNQMKN